MSEFTDALESSMRLDRRIDLLGCVRTLVNGQEQVHRIAPGDPGHYVLRLFGFVMGCPVVIRDVPNVVKLRNLGATEMARSHPMRKLLDGLPILEVL